MKNDLLVFSNPEFGSVRTIMIDGETWLVGKDVATALGYQNPSKALLDHVDDEDKLNNESLSSLGQRGGWLINESGLYSLVLSSKLPGAKKFRRWVTSEVLPTIRRTGGYKLPQNYLEALQELVRVEGEREKLEAELEEARPKVEFANAITATESSISVGTLAKILKQNGINIGKTRLFAWFREKGFCVRKNGAERNLPTQYAMNLGYLEIEECISFKTNGDKCINKMVRVTPKGQEYFIRRFLDEAFIAKYKKDMKKLDCLGV